MTAPFCPPLMNFYASDLSPGNLWDLDPLTAYPQPNTSARPDFHCTRPLQPAPLLPPSSHHPSASPEYFRPNAKISFIKLLGPGHQQKHKWCSKSTWYPVGVETKTRNWKLNRDANITSNNYLGRTWHLNKVGSLSWER